ncbi:double-strand break repair helicase AddA [Profundibacterium mesophilum]|uniref:DNA 3'-5' helicase n=1 Tax=Profundibacterium mesophilum KAUST100406-0324 TaxID=1037889 RepID=A0A921TFB9_9RHOB|nr:double-strand break repair helicase AddA [Profundibacterium mesophilum]KAF0676304.1 ATP-dependent DNA helicase [Profundibacterium mesophilum KAUST100406-0324]
MNEATLNQIRAADPRASTWLSANAGSGKTRVLTDRVARLLLDGASPQNILCLTYTKAAASEMQNRLFQRLGAWAMLPEAELRAALRALGAGGDIDAERLASARRLFARAIETPGGLKIQTIHSFCASLLRSFPLESGVTPQFTEMDERTAERLLRDCIEELAADDDAPGVVDAVARHLSDDAAVGFAAAVIRNRDAFRTPFDEDRLRGALGLAPGTSAETALANVFLGSEADLLRGLAAALAEGTAAEQRTAPRIAALADGFAPELWMIAELETFMLLGAGAKEPFSSKAGSYPAKKTRTAMGESITQLDALMDRLAEGRDTRMRLQALERSLALHRFAAGLLPLYAAKKQVRGWLDFDDLILKARDLLTNPDVAQWVLYRLDGGIDHILVDEAQDTSPVQWQVIAALAQEVTAGEGTHAAGERTIFVVGDRKQSIYSFQGADPDSFETMAADFGERLDATGGLARRELLHSFRSSAAVLGAVDAVFDAESQSGLGRDVRHLAFHEALPGRVDLWPLIESEEEEDPPDWHNPVDHVSPEAASVILADMIAGEIRRLIDQGETIPHPGGTRRPLHEGDFLILLPKRSRLFYEIIRACKRRDLAIAGPDRLGLTDQLPVKDLRALLSVLVTPEDDLSLAAVLRSPLFGWSEAELYDLAAGRGRRYLIQALRKREDCPRTRAVLSDLAEHADFLRPYELLERILQRHDGRARLLGRLGADAEDAIDELLNQAQLYERADIPSLTGFLAWLDSGDVVVKRQADAAGSRIRVMSVHGAKGLEAPVVILPETMSRTAPDRTVIDRLGDGTPIWRMSKDVAPEIMRSAQALKEQKNRAEDDRLLYVAMTRAESWLIVCGHGTRPKETSKAQKSWYLKIEEGLAALGATSTATPAGPGLRSLHGDWEAGTRAPRPAPPAPGAHLPDWFDTPAPPPPPVQAPLSPSGLGGAKTLAGEPGIEGEAALRRGTAIHRLLEHMPGWPVADRADRAAALLHDDAEPLSPEEIRSALEEAAGVLDAPGLSHLLTGDGLSEVEVTARLEALGGLRVYGAIDRLVFDDDEILAVDFKSNTRVPGTPTEVPEGLLRQMGAYCAALEQIYPGRTVRTALLWTRGPSLMELPREQVMAALRRAAPT